MLGFFLLLARPFLLPLCLSRVTPCNISLQVVEQVKPGSFKLVTNETEAEQPDPETIFVVGGDGSIRFCILLIVGLGGDRKAELDVRLDLSRMDLTVEGPKFNGALLKHTVEIQAMVTAAVVMLMASVLTTVPYRF